MLEVWHQKAELQPSRANQTNARDGEKIARGGCVHGSPVVVIEWEGASLCDCGEVNGGCQECEV